MVHTLSVLQLTDLQPLELAEMMEDMQEAKDKSEDKYIHNCL